MNFEPTLNPVDILKVVLDNNLITDTNDIQFLFPEYPLEDNSTLTSLLIEDVIEWGYIYDKLEDFFGEHADNFIDTNNATHILKCEINLITSVPTRTTYTLYMFESSKYQYYLVRGSGEYSDCMDTSHFFQIVPKEFNYLVVSHFKDECKRVFTNDEEFDFDELLSEGHTIEFTS